MTPEFFLETCQGVPKAAGVLTDLKNLVAEKDEATRTQWLTTNMTGSLKTMTGVASVLENLTKCENLPKTPEMLKKLRESFEQIHDALGVELIKDGVTHSVIKPAVSLLRKLID